VHNVQCAATTLSRPPPRIMKQALTVAHPTTPPANHQCRSQAKFCPQKSFAHHIFSSVRYHIPPRTTITTNLHNELIPPPVSQISQDGELHREINANWNCSTCQKWRIAIDVSGVKESMQDASDMEDRLKRKLLTRDDHDRLSRRRRRTARTTGKCNYYHSFRFRIRSNS
jgi:hypothetical protein